MKSPAAGPTARLTSSNPLLPTCRRRAILPASSEPARPPAGTPLLPKSSAPRLRPASFAPISTRPKLPKAFIGKHRQAGGAALLIALGDFGQVEIAQSYQQGGATCLSVLNHEGDCRRHDA